jgi:hypothetical protein
MMGVNAPLHRSGGNAVRWCRKKVSIDVVRRE